MSSETREFYPETRAMVERRAVGSFFEIQKMLSMRSADNFGGGSAIASSHADQMATPRGIVVGAAFMATAGIVAAINYVKNGGEQPETIDN